MARQVSVIMSHESVGISILSVNTHFTLPQSHNITDTMLRSFKQRPSPGLDLQVVGCLAVIEVREC